MLTGRTGWCWWMGGLANAGPGTGHVSIHAHARCTPGRAARHVLMPQSCRACFCGALFLTCVALNSATPACQNVTPVYLVFSRACTRGTNTPSSSAPRLPALTPAVSCCTALANVALRSSAFLSCSTGDVGAGCGGAGSAAGRAAVVAMFSERLPCTCNSCRSCWR